LNEYVELKGTIRLTTLRGDIVRKWREQQRSAPPHLQGQTRIASDVDHIITPPSVGTSKSSFIATAKLKPPTNLLPSSDFTSLHNIIPKMAPPTDRKEILAAFRKQIESGTAIVGAGAGMSIPINIIIATTTPN
jgi:hypothetical protein